MFKMLNREGSKFRYLDHIIPLFPSHRLYLEPFLGTGCVLLNKEKASTEIINDTDDFIYDFFNCFRDDSARLLGEVENLLLHPKILEECLSSDDPYLRTAGRLNFTFVALFNNYDETASCCVGIGANHGKSLWLENLRGNLNFFKKRLEHVIITRLDVFDFLNSLQKRERIKSTFVYCDPPYLAKTRLKANKGWTKDHLDRLISLLLELNVNFAISEYMGEEQMALFEKYGLHVEPLATSTGIPSTWGHKKIECLAVNYDINKLF